MKQIIFLLTLLAAGWNDVHAGPPPTNAAAPGRILIIDSSSMPVGAGKATLIIGKLRRTNDVYAGDYKLKVFPYFYKNEKGRLAIVVSDAALAKVSRGEVAEISGIATTIGKGNKSRHIDATATPVNINRGTLKLWFKSGSRTMTFTPAYHFAENETAMLLDQMAGTNPVATSNHWLPVSSGEASKTNVTKP